MEQTNKNLNKKCSFFVITLVDNEKKENSKPVEPAFDLFFFENSHK